MPVDNNFDRLEKEVTRLVEVLEKLRQQNAECAAQIENLTTENEQLKSDSVRLQQIEIEYQEITQTREVIKDRIENILAKLDSIEL